MKMSEKNIDIFSQSEDKPQKQCYLLTLQAYDLVAEYRRRQVYKADNPAYSISQEYAGYFSLLYQESHQQLCITCLPSKNFDGRDVDSSTLIEVEHMLYDEKNKGNSSRFIYTINKNSGTYEINRIFVDDAETNWTYSEIFRLYQLGEALKKGEVSTYYDDVAHAKAANNQAYAQRERSITNSWNNDMTDNLQDLRQLFGCALPIV